MSLYFAAGQWTAGWIFGLGLEFQWGDKSGTLPVHEGQVIHWSAILRLSVANHWVVVGFLRRG